MPEAERFPRARRPSSHGRRLARDWRRYGLQMGSDQEEGGPPAVILAAVDSLLAEADGSTDRARRLEELRQRLAATKEDEPERRSLDESPEAS